MAAERPYRSCWPHPFGKRPQAVRISRHRHTDHTVIRIALVATVPSHKFLSLSDLGRTMLAAATQYAVGCRPTNRV
jgi:hypothetical protein